MLPHIPEAGSVQGRKRGTGNGEARSPSGTSCNAAEIKKKKEGISKKKWRKELGARRMSEKVGKQGLRGRKHNATTLFVPVSYFALIQKRKVCHSLPPVLNK